MLLPRIITACILIPLTLALLYYLPPAPFLLVTVILTLYGAWEWAGLMQLSTKGKWGYLLWVFAMGALTVWAAVNFPQMPFYFLGAILIWWCIALVLIVTYPRSSSLWSHGLILRGLMGILVLVPFWWTLNYIRGEGALSNFLTLVYLLVLIWAADSAAYFAGRKFGKHKLAPLVSPGKSWEGCAGALISTLIIPLIVFTMTKLPYRAWLAGEVLAVVTIFFSIVGDLFESMLKREAGVKDSGALLPGHGGLLDRIDSLTAATPVFAFGSWLIVYYYF